MLLWWAWQGFATQISFCLTFKGGKCLNSPSILCPVSAQINNLPERNPTRFSLIFNGFCAGKDVYKNLAKIWNAPFLEKGQFESDVETLRKIGVEFCLRNKCLPIIDKDGNQFFALSQPDKFDDLVQFTPFKQKTKIK
mgnify:CR=1 FL=1